MNEIKCPKCKQVFKVDEAGYADILKQVRDGEFTRELHERLELAEKDKESAIKLVETEVKSELQAEVSKKETELAEVRAQRDAAVSELKAEKDAEIAHLQAKVDSAETEKQTGTSTEAVNQGLKKSGTSLLSRLERQRCAEQKLLESSLKDKYETELEVKRRYDRLLQRNEGEGFLQRWLARSLEQHCEIEFNRSAGPRLSKTHYFEKDNDSSDWYEG